MKFDMPRFLLLTLAFIVCVPIGTLSHELGHIAVAEALGYDTRLYFASMDYNYEKVTPLHGALITLGGPVQTILTGMVGLGLLRYRKSAMQESGLRLLDWVAVFLALFWLREVFNLAAGLALNLFYPEVNPFGGDELGLSQALHLPDGAVPIALGILGFWAAWHVVFTVVPKPLRLTFIAAGLVGGLAGFFLWMEYLGPWFLP